MKILFGLFFKTLSYQVDKEIKKSLYKNEAFINSRWGFFEQNIIQWSTHYKKYILLAFILVVLVVINGIQWQSWVTKHYIIKYLPDWRELLEWQGVFLSGQLTIVGVVYPLVVGLISVLFQNKSAKRVIFPIYQKYSGFMFAGLSGLALSCFIVVGYFLRPTIGEQIYAVICLTTALWLSSNLLLTAWFFVKTFRMLDENSCEEIVFRFSIHETGEIDVRRRIKQVLLGNAVHHKLIANPDHKILEIMTYEYYNNEYQEITRKIKRDEEIKDIRLWLLNAAIRLQIIILRLKNIKNGKLIVQPNIISNIMILARYDGFEMNPIVQALIKFSFSLDKVNIGLSTVLSGFIGPAIDALRHGDTREFSGAVENLASWHTEIAQALTFKNDEEYLDNWLLLPASGMLGRNYLDELMAEYYRLAREAVERIPENSRFYADMLYLYSRIYASRNTLVKQEMRSLIQGSYHMWYLLVEWRSYNSESTDLRIANKYEDILYGFVSSWESWLMFFEPRSSKTENIDKAYPAFITHLEFTASTAISALRFNNFEAAGWGVDMLINWLENYSHNNNWNAEYRWLSVLINHYLLPLTPDNTTWQTILRGNEYDYHAAFDLSLKNANIDLRVITACYMLLKPGDEHRVLLTKYVKALLAGIRIHPSSSVGQSRYNISNAGELLGAYIRQRDYRHCEKDTYGGWLSSILESFGWIYEERRVSGRIYTGWVENSIRNMNKAYVEIAISMSDTRWTLPNDWEDALFSNYFRYKDRESIISDLRDWIKIVNEDFDHILIDPNRIEFLKTNFIKSVENVIQIISDAQRQTVVDAEIDRNRLVKFGETSSAIFRGEGDSKFPLELFDDLDRDADLDDNCSFEANINYNKELIALDIDVNQARNEDKWMADYISDDLKLNVLRTLLRYPQSSSYKYTDTNNILSDIRRLSESFLYPVLFVGSQQLKNTLYKTFYDLKTAKKIHDISRQDGFDNEYICHVGCCEIYSLNFNDVDFCLLTTKELFDTVHFRKFAKDRYVDVDFELNEDSDTLGRLIFKYWMKVDLTKDTQCIKLELATKEDDVA